MFWLRLKHRVAAFASVQGTACRIAAAATACIQAYWLALLAGRLALLADRLALLAGRLALLVGRW